MILCSIPSSSSSCFCSSVIWAREHNSWSPSRFPVLFAIFLFVWLRHAIRFSVLNQFGPFSIGKWFFCSSLAFCHTFIGTFSDRPFLFNVQLHCVSSVAVGASAIKRLNQIKSTISSRMMLRFFFFAASSVSIYCFFLPFFSLIAFVFSFVSLFFFFFFFCFDAKLSVCTQCLVFCCAWQTKETTKLTACVQSPNDRVDLLFYVNVFEFLVCALVWLLFVFVFVLNFLPSKKLSSLLRVDFNCGLNSKSVLRYTFDW